MAWAIKGGWFWAEVDMRRLSGGLAGRGPKMGGGKEEKDEILGEERQG